MVKLSVLATEAGTCSRCKLHEGRTRVVFASGDPYSDLMIIGEGPGADEDASGEPFVWASGKLLDKMLAFMGFARSEVYVGNVVKCRPPNNRKPAPNEVDSCKPYILAQIDLVRPKVIVALGATAGRLLLPNAFATLTEVRGTLVDLPSGVKVMPTWHPAYCLRLPAAKRDVEKDLRVVCGILGKTPINAGSGRAQVPN